jgi:hypothetical protein
MSQMTRSGSIDQHNEEMEEMKSRHGVIKDRGIDGT